MAAPAKPAADASGAKNARSAAGLPAAALRRFANDLEGEVPANKFLQINRDRVSEFINKKSEQEKQDNTTRLTQKCMLPIPGICDYGPMNDPPRKPLLQLQSLPEFQSSLGMRSRFGDGDGSFFDQWLNSDIVKTKHLYDKDGFPVMKFRGETQGGFKKHLSDYKAGMDDKKHLTYVPTYAERKAERLRREAEEKQKAQEVAEKSTALPPLTRFNSATSMLTDDSRQPDFVRLEMPPIGHHLKLPMLDSLSPADKESYFGQEARLAFFESYRQLARMRNTIGLGEEDREIEALLTARTQQIEAFEDKEELAELIHMAMDLDVCSEAGSEDAQEMGDLVDEHNRVTPFSRQPSRRAMILEDGDEASAPQSGVLSRQGTFRNAAGLPLYLEDDSKPSTARSARSGQSSPLMRKRLLLPSRSNPRIARPRTLYSRQRVDDSRTVTDEEKRRLFAHIHGESLEPTPGVRPLSARSRFLVGCVRKGILPQASLIIRRTVTTTMSIASFGIGNELALLFAASLSSLPMLEGLNISDNNLTDAGLVPIVKALHHCNRLQSFDISRNKVDAETAKALLQFLSAEYCPLTHLYMGNANVDDNEAAKFVKLIANRRNFKELDLSENLLGSHEFTLRTQETAGTALGSLLSDPRCTLEKLNLSWNMLRFQSGIELVTALKVNTSLTYLDLSFNRLCGEGGDALGNALHANRTLKVLKLAHNDITSRPCCTILSGVVSCESLTEVDLSKNPIGELGARLLLAIDLKCGERVKVDIRNCQLRVQDNSCWFDPVKPRKEYTLRLSDPYERCVCIELLRLVSGPSSEYAIESYQFKGPDDTEFRDLPLDIYTSKSGDGSDASCISPREAELKIEEARNTVKETANRIFRQYDTDASGALDRHELATILDQIGMEGSQMMVNQLMSIYDTDGSGMVEEEEFVAFLMDIKSSSVESADVAAADRFVYIKDESTENSISRGGKPASYFPPETGVVHLKLNTDSSKEISPQHISRRSVETMLDATKSSEDRSAIFDYALSVMRLQFSDAQTFYRVMLKELGSAHQVLVRLVPRMATPNDARLLITYVTNNDFEHLHMLRQSLGPLYAIYIGLPNGYYRLNLAEEPDQRCLKALVELSNSNAAHRKRVNLGDTSQDGNWTGFRNAVYEGKALVLTHEWLNNLPEKGRLEFDFININHANMSEMEISHLRLFRIMQGLGMVTEDKRRRIFDKLTMDREEGRTVSKGSGYRPHTEMKTTTMEQAANFLHTLYGTYATSRPAVVEQPIGEAERPFLHPAAGAAPATAATTAFNTRSPTPAANSPRITPKNGASATTFPPTPKAGGASQPAGMVHKAKDGPKDNTSAAVHNDSHGSFVKDMMESGLVDPAIVAERLLETLKFALAGRFITCIQLALLVEKFPDGFLSCGAFSTFRTELVISLYTRVVDPINFDYVLKDLEGSEVAILLFRLGWLNIWNPIKAEGRTVLDLSRREERQVLRMLLVLNFAEPGPSWQDPSYRRSRTDPPEENWSLPASWYTESTLPTSGILSLKYFSGMSCGQDDCAPNPACRHTLMALVLAKSYAADVWSGNKANLDSVANLVNKMGCKLYFTTEAQHQHGKSGQGR